MFYFRILEIFNFRKRIIIETFSFFFIQKSSEKESTDLRSPSPSAKRSLDEAEQPVEKKLKTCEENVAEVGAASEPAAQGKFIIKGVLSTGRVRLDLLSRSVKGRLISESFLFCLKSPKMGAKSRPWAYSILRSIVLRVVIWHLSLEVWAKVKKFLPPLDGSGQQF